MLLRDFGERGRHKIQVKLKSVVHRVIKAPPEERKQLSQLALVLLKQWYQRAGVASRQVLRSDGWEEILQVLLPAALKEKVLIEVHQNHGHQGVDKTLELLRLWCYWPRMSSNVRRWCQTCERCQVAKDSGLLARSFLGHLLASEPNEILAIHYALLEPTHNGLVNVLVLTEPLLWLRC